MRTIVAFTELFRDGDRLLAQGRVEAVLEQEPDAVSALPDRTAEGTPWADGTAHRHERNRT